MQRLLRIYLFAPLIVVFCACVLAGPQANAAPRLRYPSKGFFLLESGKDGEFYIDLPPLELEDAIIKKFKWDLREKGLEHRATVGEADIPHFLKTGKRAQALTGRGIQELTIKKVEVSSEYTSAGLIVTFNERLITERVLDFTDGWRGIVAFDWVFPPRARLRKIRDPDSSPSIPRRQVKSIFESVTSGLAPSDRAKAMKIGMGSEQLRFVKGDFFGLGGSLIWLSTPEESGGSTMTFAGVVDAKGKLVRTLVPVHIGAGERVQTLWPDFAVDIDGDGVEGAIVTEGFYESEYVNLYESDGEEVVKITVRAQEIE